MAYLKEIVTIVNDALVARALSTERFVGKRTFGIAATITYKEKDGSDVRKPMLTNNTDDEIYVGYDSQFPVTIYHKVSTSTTEPDPEKSYGDHLKVVTQTANIQMIVYGNRNKIKLSPEELEALLIDSFPSNLTKAQKQPYKLRSVTITPGQTNFNSTAVYQQEYSAESRMKPNDIFIAINYTVVSSFKQGCLDLCEC